MTGVAQRGSVALNLLPAGAAAGVLIFAVVRGWVLTAIVSVLGCLVLAVSGVHTARTRPTADSGAPRESASFLRRQWETPYRFGLWVAIAIALALIALDLAERDFANIWWHAILVSFAVILLYIRQRGR